MIPLLPLLLLLPLVGAFACLLFPRHARSVALGAAFLTLWAAGSLWALYDVAGSGYRFLVSYPLLHGAGLDVLFTLGVDGLSLPLVVLTALLGVVAVLISQREVHVREPAHYATLLGLVGAVLLVFSALDLIVLFLAWEAVLVLMFLLILRWGLENRRYAAMRFLVFTGIGSAALLLGLLILGVSAGTFSLPGSIAALSGLSSGTRLTILLLIGLAALIKMPIAPFHTWLPDAHVQAPTAGSVLLAGVLLKMGAYALIRIGSPLLATAPWWAIPLLFWLGAVTAVYGAWVCLGQTHLKRLIAYSSVGHMGLVLVGIAAAASLGPAALAPAIFLMVSHGLLSPLLFAVAGFIHERTGTFDLAALSGLSRTMPVAAWLLAFVALASMGLPTLSGFIAEVSTLVVSMTAFGVVGLIPVLGVILTGGYTVLLITRTTLSAGQGVGGDSHGAHPLAFVLLIVPAFVIGIWPSLLFSLIATIT